MSCWALDVLLDYSRNAVSVFFATATFAYASQATAVTFRLWWGAMAARFISYATENRDQAMQLAEALDARGWSVRADERPVGGVTFGQSIEATPNA